MNGGGKYVMWVASALPGHSTLQTKRRLAAVGTKYDPDVMEKHFNNKQNTTKMFTNFNRPRNVNSIK